MQTLTNGFHGTTVRVRDARKTYDILCRIPEMLTQAQKAHARRVRNALCGSPSCTCGVVVP